jgi:hypothetical protein
MPPPTSVAVAVPPVVPGQRLALPATEAVVLCSGVQATCEKVTSKAPVFAVGVAPLAAGN